MTIPIQDAEAYALQLSRRDYRREGIEMFLALENLQAEAGLEPVSEGGALADSVEKVAGQLLKTRQNDPVRALRLALEVVATHDFGQMTAPKSDRLDPAATGAGRSPLRLSVDPTAGAAALVRALREGQFVRSVNYHNTLFEDRAKLEKQLRYLAERFQSIGVGGLERLLAGDPWEHERPPVLLVFYEGLRNHFDVAVPLLEELGLTGIFCLIPGFIDAPVQKQVAFAEKSYIDVRSQEYADGRVALTWDEVRSLDERKHSFVCHTMTHADPDAPEFDPHYQSVEAVARMEAELERDVAAFVWRRGLEWGAAPHADALLTEAGIRLLVNNFKVQRLPV